MKKATIEQMDNGYLLTLESDKMGDKPQKWVENKLRKICTHLAYFFTDGVEGFRIRVKE